MLVPRTCTLWRLVHASLSNRKHPVRFIRSGKYFTWQIIMECQLRLYLSPPPQQRGPWDSPRQNPGENTAQNMCFVQCTMVALSQLYYYRECKKSLTLSYLLLVAHRIKIICHGIIQRKSKSGASVSFSRR